MTELSINLSYADYIIATKFFKNLNICFAISVVEVNQNIKNLITRYSSMFQQANLLSPLDYLLFL